MAAVALVDFGSTYTKVRIVERGEGRLLARAEAPTTVGSDLMEGYGAALAAARERLAAPVAIEERLAASSAGGGLRVAAIGLVADLTGAAARQAALNAGARVTAVLAGALDEAALDRLHAARPEIVLFAGGTDGGQADLVLENARRLAARPFPAFAVVACNAAIAAQVAGTLEEAGMEAGVAANVMPRLGRLEIDSARRAILDAFLEHVIGGKGLSSSPEFRQMVKMPTPEAVLEATRLLSRGTEGESGVGDVVVVDVGGATTDVHSDRCTEVATPGIDEPLLPAPATLRTVEGDLGLRAGAAGVLAADERWIGEQLDGAVPSLGHSVSRRAAHPEWIPDTPEEGLLDGLLATSCATQALRRHCGTMLLSRGEDGVPTLVREGPDLREARCVLGTGGVFAHRDDGEEVLSAALARPAPRSLAPREPRLALDRSYVLAAAGLLATIDPVGALRLLRRELALAKN
ncbi:MAG TPA: glutamate mutase L [Solirubrobacterales bacterium]|nr:glutamate mutase L [Solirubrobacterales bacterium]